MPFGPAMPSPIGIVKSVSSASRSASRPAPVNGIPRTGSLRRPVMCASSATFLESPRARPIGSGSVRRHALA